MFDDTEGYFQSLTWPWLHSGLRLSDAELLRFVQDLSQSQDVERSDATDASALEGRSCMAVLKKSWLVHEFHDEFIMSQGSKSIKLWHWKWK